MNSTNQPRQLSCVALIVCDQVIEDALTHNKTVVGIFNRIQAPGFPVFHPRLTIFAALTGGRTKTTIRVLLNRVDGEKTVMSLQGDVEFGDPRVITDFVFILQNVGFPEPGLYSISIHEGDRMLSSRPILVQETGQES